ncbi:MAG TPA: protease pro-enzyme activation domain-containing protein [Streptosporangiaceae bacterium]|jgi:subtilase family serine protease
MSRWRTLAAGLAAAATVAGTLTAVSGPAAAAPRPRETTLNGSAAPFTAHTRSTGAVPAGTLLTVELWLRPDLAAATRFAAAVSTPGSPSFRHYLSPAAYTARFAAPAAEVARAESWLRAAGFTGIGTDSGRSYVRATAPVSKINAAFRVRLLNYPASPSVNAGRYRLRANDHAVSLPTSLAGGVLAVTGLDNAELINPMIRTSHPAAATHAAAGAHVPCSRYYGQHLATGLPKQFGVTSFPSFVCGYSATQMRSAYRASWAATGKGQTIALVEQGLTKNMFLTLQDYAKANHMPAPSARRYAQLSLGKDTCGDPFNIEEQLDVESSYDMAPGAHQLVVGGDSCNRKDNDNQATYNADVAILDGTGNHPLATVASNSWESGTESQPLGQTKLVHAYLLRSAAEGVGMYFSAGDGSGVLEPSIDPDAIAVGGTTLGVGASGQRLFETGWSTGISQLKSGHWAFLGEDGASGGGPSVFWKQPAYQHGVVPASLGSTRSAPDISADADPFTGINVGLLHSSHGKQVFTQESIGGTSESSPLVAGMVTAAQQGQKVPFGFVNPVLYKLSGTSALFDTLPLTSKSPPLYRGIECDLLVFANICLGPKTDRIPSLTTNDDQSPSMKGYTGQVTLRGYDNMTGLGTPDMPNFARDLREIG